MSTYNTDNTTTNIVLDENNNDWNKVNIGSNTELTMIISGDSTSVEYYINTTELSDAFGDVLAPREDVSGIKDNIFIRKVNKNKNAKIIIFGY